MCPARENRKALDEVLALLSRLKGVKHAFFLTSEMRSGLGKIERKYPSIGPLTVQNDGVIECLRRKHVACIVKDRSFRAPPHSTVMLVNDSGDVLGRELLPGEKLRDEPGVKHIFLGDDFVIFARAGSGKGAKFVLPPVSFKELDDMEGTEDVVSSSPSTAGDLYLRRLAGLEDDPKLASILIGFDLD
jgi:hypothetical protein